MSKIINIPGRFHSTEKGNVSVGANEVLDDTKGKKQNVINSETDAELLRLSNEKQDNLTFDNAPTENSNNPVKSSGVYAADKALSDAIEAILLLIPSAATELNKLVDLATMNSSISTATATFRGTYNAVTDLHLTYQATHEQIAAALDALNLPADNNDYAFVQVPTSDSSTEIRRTERYKHNGTNWGYEYDLNTSGFTAVQWASINSGITALLVAKLGALPTADELAALLGQKQDNLTFDTKPTALSTNPVTSGGVYTAILAVSTALSTYQALIDPKIAAIEGKIPSGASSSNQLTAKDYVDGIKNTLQGYIDTINGKIPAAAATNNKLTDKNYVDTLIAAITAKIPDAASGENKLVDTAAMMTYIAGIINVLDASFNVTSIDGHITLHITQVDGVITSVQVQGSDIASAADLALKASQADLTALASRVSTAEGNITSLTGRMGTAETNISALQSLYSGLTQSNIIIGSLPATGSANIIYRVPGTSSYSDYMWNGSSFILMATYSDYDFSAMAEIKEAVYTWKLEDGVLNGYINSSGAFAEGSSWRVKYIKVEEGDLIDFYGHVSGSYRAGYTDNVPTSSGFSLSTILPTDTVSPIIASRSGYFCISDYWDGSFTVQLKAKVKLKDVWDKFPKKLEVAPEITTGYITLSGDIADYGSQSFRCDNYLLTAGKEYIVYCTDITGSLGGNYYFGFALSKNKPSADGAFAFKLYNMRDIDTIKIVPAVNMYLVINQGYNYLGRALFKIFAGESYAATGLEIADIKEQLNSSYKGKNCIYIGDSISTNNNCIWKGLIESEYGLSYVRNISGQLAPADGGITLMPPQTESSELSQKSIWYRCAANRMNIYTFDVVSLMGGVNDMTNSELIIGTIDDLPYVDDASSFSDPTAVTDTWVNNLTFAQALMGCIEMLKRDFPTKEIIIDTVIPCSGNYGNWTDPGTGLKGSEAIAELQVRVAEKYGLKVAPMYWSARTSENAGRRVFATDGVHPNLAFATIMKTIFADSLGM